MKYCTRCSSEYQDSVSVCSDCPGAELVSAEEMRRRGRPLAHEVDTRRFTQAATAEDPFTAEQYAGVLEAAGIEVFSRPRAEESAGPATPWWELLVPEEHLARASQLLGEEKAREEASAEEAALAAEEEEAEEAAKSGS